MNLSDYLQLFKKKSTLIEVFDSNTRESWFQGEVKDCLTLCETGIAYVISIELSKNKIDIYVEVIPSVD